MVETPYNHNSSTKMNSSKKVKKYKRKYQHFQKKMIIIQMLTQKNKLSIR